MINYIDAPGRAVHQFSISNVPVDELDAMKHVREISAAPSLQIIDHYNAPRVLAHQEIDQVTSYKAGAPSHKDVSQIEFLIVSRGATTYQ